MSALPSDLAASDPSQASPQVPPARPAEIEARRLRGGRASAVVHAGRVQAVVRGGRAQTILRGSWARATVLAASLGTIAAVSAISAAPGVALAAASINRGDRPVAMSAFSTGGVAASQLPLAGADGHALLPQQLRSHPVRALQAALHVVIDGDFGPETEAAVRRFQAEHGLPANGIVDARTWAALGFHEMRELRPRPLRRGLKASAPDAYNGGTEAHRELRRSGKRTKKQKKGSKRLQTPATAPDAGASPAGAVTPAPTPALTAPVPPSTEGYVNPLPSGFTAGRTDMGVDFTSVPGTAILAIGQAKILGIYPNWFPPGGPNGGNMLEYELLTGPDATRRVYVAEQIEITVAVGETVAAGALIGRYASEGTGIEMGWAAGGGVTLAQATTGYEEGQETEAGQSFRAFLQSLGVAL